jgi:hypothetical protein
MCSDTTIECCGCHTTGYAHGEWIANLPEPPSVAAERPDNTHVITQWGDRRVSQRSVLKQAERWMDDGSLMVITAYDNNLTGKHWLGFETEEDREYILAQLESLAQQIKDHPIG